MAASRVSAQTLTRLQPRLSVRPAAFRVAPRQNAVARSSIRSQAQARFNSTTNPNVGGAVGTSGTSAGGVSPAIAGALAGAGAAVLTGYVFYRVSGAKTAVDAYSTTKSYFNSAADKLKANTPEPNEALEALRKTAYHYAAFVPGGKSYVDTAFKDIDAVREKHGDEVNKIVSDTYAGLKKIADEKGFSLDAASRSWELLQDQTKRISALAVDASEQILDNHPTLKSQVGGSVNQLKDLADKYGPDAKKQLDDTYGQIQNIVKSGVSFDTVSKIKKLVEEKKEQIQKLGDEAWKKGLDTAKPYFDKNPQVKELIEKNADALKQGNISELWDKVKAGNVDDLKDYVQKAGEAAKDKANQVTGGGIEKYLAMVPGFAGLKEIAPHFQKLQEVADKRGDEAKDLLKKTYDDIEEVLKKRVKEAENLASKAKDDAKTSKA